MPPFNNAAAASRIGGVAERISGFSVVALAALLPVFFIPSVSVPLAQAKVYLLAAFVFVAGLAWVVQVVSDRVIRFPKEPLFYAALALPLVYVISALAAGWNKTAFVGSGMEQDTVAIVVLWYALFALSAVVLANRAASVRSVIRGLLAGGALVILFQALRVLFPESSLLSLGGVFPSNFSNTIGSWHDFGLFIALYAFIASAYAALERGVIRVGLYVVGVFSLLFLLLVNFQDVWIAAAALFGIYALHAVVSSWRNGWDSTKRVIFFACVALVLAVGAFFTDVVARNIPERIVVTAIEVRPSWQGTFAIGQSVIANQSPFFGSGPNSFAREWNRYKTPDINSTIFWNTEFGGGIGFIPTSVVTTGVIGAVGWLILIAGLLWLGRGFFGFGSGRTHPMFTLLFLGVLYLVAVHIVNMPSAAASGLAFLFLGLLVAMKSREGEGGTYAAMIRSDSAIGIAGGVALVGGVLLVLFVDAALLRTAVSNTFVNAAIVTYTETASVEEAEKQLRRALAVHPENDRAHRASVELGLVALGAFLQNPSIAEEQKEALRVQVADTVQHGLSAVSIDSANHQNWLSLAFLYQSLAGAGVEGALEEARKAYEGAAEENPTNPLPYLRLAQLAVARGEGDEALRQLESAFTLKPNFAEAYILQAQIFAETGNLEEAVRAAATVAQIAPEDAGAWYLLGTILYAGESFEEAAAAFEQAVRLENNYANAAYSLALSYAELGRVEDAVALLERIAEFNAENEVLLETLNTLKARVPVTEEE